MNANINLLLRTDEESIKRKRSIKIFNFTAIASLILVGLISLGIFILIRIVNPDSLREEREDLLSRMSQFQSRQYNLFILNDRIENINQIMGKRGNISNTMNEILIKVPSQLSIESFEIDDKSIVITGQSKSLFTIGELINNLTDMVRRKEIIKSLTLNSLTLDRSIGVFRISIKSEL
jgi:hypothetical protein